MIETLDAGKALAREMDLLADVAADSTRHHLWFWQSPQCLVVPRKLSLHPDFDAASRELADAGWPVFARATGGDVTPQGPGVVNVTHVYASPKGREYGLEHAYDALCTPIETALGPSATRGWQPGAFCDGAHNVQFKDKKFAGTALRFRPCKEDRSRRAVLAHALMLFNPPERATIDALNVFLERLNQGRVIDLAAHTGLPADVSPAAFLARLTAAFDVVPT